MKKRLATFLMAICLILTLFPIGVRAATIVDSGECSDKNSEVYWKFTSDGTLTIYGDGGTDDWAYSGYEPMLEPWLEYERKITSVIVKDDVTRIGDFAFSSCVNLTRVSLPDTLESIGQGAFYECKKLKTVTIPDSVKELEQEIFGACSSLTSVKLPKGITKIPNCMFEECTALKKYVVPSTVTEIGGGAFSSCINLTEVTIPDSVTVIGTKAFEFCESLTSIDIPAGVTQIGLYAFDHCVNLKNITLPDGIPEIGHGFFESCKKLTSIDIPASVTYIGVAFMDCTGLKTVYFSGDAPNIPNSDTFHGVTAKVYYPADNETWTESVRQDYEGNLTWIARERPDAPTVTGSNAVDTGKIRLTWDAVKNAVQYRVYRSTNEDGVYKLMYITEGTSYTNTSANEGKRYYYYVEAVDQHKYVSDPSNIVSGVYEVPRVNLTGDVDGSGSVDFFDGMYVLQYYAGLIDENQIDISAADVDGSGNINFFDGMYILQCYAGIVETLPAEV